MKCIICNCTTEQACLGGCSWVSQDPPICSKCFTQEIYMQKVIAIQLNWIGGMRAWNRLTEKTQRKWMRQAMVVMDNLRKSRIEIKVNV